MAIATIFANRIVMGTFKFADVPRLLKDNVRIVLEEMDMEHLAVE